MSITTAQVSPEPGAVPVVISAETCHQTDPPASITMSFSS